MPDQSRCDLRLRRPLDYETKSSFVLQILAEVKGVSVGGDVAKNFSFCVMFPA